MKIKGIKKISENLDPTPQEEHIIFQAAKRLIGRAARRLQKEGIPIPDDIHAEWNRLCLLSEEERVVVALALHRNDLPSRELRLQFCWQTLNEELLADKGRPSGDVPMLDGDLFLRSAEHLSLRDIQHLISYDEGYRLQTPELFGRIANAWLYGNKVTEEGFHEPYIRFLKKTLSPKS